jgi:hypothetical protein
MFVHLIWLPHLQRQEYLFSVLFPFLLHTYNIPDRYLLRENWMWFIRQIWCTRSFISLCREQ